MAIWRQFKNNHTFVLHKKMAIDCQVVVESESYKSSNETMRQPCREYEKYTRSIREMYTGKRYTGTY